MTRYYLHVVNRVGSASDDEGLELADLAEAVEQAKEGIRSIISDEAKAGRIDFDGRIEIADESGATRQVVPFPEAFDIVTAANRAFPED